MLNAEFAILGFIQNHLRCGILDLLMPKITSLGNAGALWIIITIIFLISKKYRAAGIVMAISLMTDLVLCNIILKPTIARIRPYDINKAVTLLIPKQTDYSFPSGHTAAAFTSVAVMYFCGCKYWKPTAILAVIIGFSRLYLYVHFPTDVLAGALIGTICGFFGYKIYKCVSKKQEV